MKIRSIFLLSSLFLVIQASYAEQDNVNSNLPTAERTQSSNAAATVSDSTSTTTDETLTTETQTAQVDAGIEQAGFSQGSVVRSAFTSEISEREPIDKLKETPNDSKVYFFTELRDMSGQTAIHRWQHNGEVKAEVEFKVGGPRWRVWSSKSFNPEWTGEWKVSVVNGANEIIKEETLMLTSSSNTAPSSITDDAVTKPVIENQVIESEVEAVQ